MKQFLDDNWRSIVGWLSGFLFAALLIFVLCDQLGWLEETIFGDMWEGIKNYTKSQLQGISLSFIRRSRLRPIVILLSLLPHPSFQAPR